jgi:hypothetical protein
VSTHHTCASTTHFTGTLELTILALCTHAPLSDRRMLIRTLKESTLLQNLPIEDVIFSAEYPNTVESWNELKMDVAGNIPIELNSAVLGASASNEHEKQQEGEKLLQLLPLLCNKLVQGVSNDENKLKKRITSEELYHTMLLRLSHKRNSAIVFAQLNKVLGSKDLALQVPKRPIKPLQHSNLIVYVSDNAIHAVMEHQYAIGLFRKSDSAGRPWIGLTATIRERINLSNDNSASTSSYGTTTTSSQPAAVRYITLQIHEEKAALY